MTKRQKLVVGRQPFWWVGLGLMEYYLDSAEKKFCRNWWQRGRDQSYEDSNGTSYSYSGIFHPDKQDDGEMDWIITVDEIDGVEAEASMQAVRAKDIKVMPVAQACHELKSRFGAPKGFPDESFTTHDVVDSLNDLNQFIPAAFETYVSDTPFMDAQKGFALCVRLSSAAIKSSAELSAFSFWVQRYSIYECSATGSAIAK
jgi:hypothetical protein